MPNSVACASSTFFSSNVDDVMIPKMRLAVSLVVWALYLAACVAPAVDISYEGTNHMALFRPQDVPGFIALLVGWEKPRTLPWSANLFFVAGWICLCRKNAVAALILGIAAALLGLTSWIFIPEPYNNLLVGYYLWQLSLVLFALGSFLIWHRTEIEKQSSESNAPKHSVR